jgi:hypothetical protein
MSNERAAGGGQMESESAFSVVPWLLTAYGSLHAACPQGPSRR